MGAHHAPDVFHVQQEISRATSGSLCAKVRKAEGDVEKAGQEVRKQEQAKEKYYRKKHGRGRPPGFDKRIKVARQHEQQTIVNRNRSLPPLKSTIQISNLPGYI